jgi:subtilisin-like proprotein convertase family protein
MGPRSVTLRGAFGVLAALIALIAAPAAGAAVDVRHVVSTGTETTSGFSNGDGILGPGETFALTERIKNADTATLHHVHGTLRYTGGGLEIQSIGDPFVTLTQSQSNYPDLPFGGAGDNATPFAGRLAPEVGCGQTLDFTLDVTSDEGPHSVPFKMGTGVAGPSVTHDSADVPVAVTDNATVESGLQVDEGGRVKDLQVRIGDLTHSATGDLKLELVAPDGAAVVLVDRRGGSAANFSNTVFSDSASQPITSAAAPFTGTFRPEQSLSTLEGHGNPGLWKLRINDNKANDTGSLNAWGLDTQAAFCDGAPVPSFVANPNPVLPGASVTLDASGSVDPNGNIVKYEWDFDNDGTYDYTSSGPSDNTVAHTFATRGKYPVRLRVTDDASPTPLTATKVVNVSVTTPPVADVQASDTAPLSGDNVTFDASGSTDPDLPGSPLDRYEWDLNGDGSFETDTGNVANTSIAYATPGSRTVRVRVTDQDGATDVASVVVDVQNRLPTASFTKPAPAIVGTLASFDAAASTDVDGTIVKYEWDIDGDGQFDDAVDDTTPAVSYTYSASGPVQVGLRITDNSGGVTVLTQTVTVTQAPVASFTANANPTSLHVPVAFDASASVDPDGPALAKYEWDLDGNGSFETDTGAVASTSHVYNVNGSVPVQVRVTDVDGATATHTLNVVAANHMPVAALAATPNPVAAGTSVTLDASGSTDGDGTIVKYDWDLDGNGSFETTSLGVPTRAHTYPNAATFNVGVRVTDNDGGTHTASLPLVVSGDPSGGGGDGSGAGGGSGGDSGGSGGGSGGGGGGGAGGGAQGLQARLTGSAIQRVGQVLSRGLAVGCQSDPRVTCVLRAELRASVAKRLGLRARAGKPIVVGTVRFVASASGRGSARLKFTAAGKRALRRARSLSLVVRGTVTGNAGRASALRTFLLRR